MTIRTLPISLASAALLTLFTGNAAQAISFYGIEFPSGTASFADRVEDYEVGKPKPKQSNRKPEKALGIPNSSGTHGTMFH